MSPIPREVVWLVSFILVEAAIIDGRSPARAQLVDVPLPRRRTGLRVLQRGKPLLLLSIAGAVVGF